jgi:hypothetical protein
MDFIIKLSKFQDPISGKEYNSILTITDRLTKEAKFASINKATDAPDTAYLVIQNVIATESLPNK